MDGGPGPTVPASVRTQAAPLLRRFLVQFLLPLLPALPLLVLCVGLLRRLGDLIARALASGNLVMIGIHVDVFAHVVLTGSDSELPRPCSRPRAPSRCARA